VRLVARALARSDDLEARGARPVDVFANQRGLIAPGKAVNDARGLGLACEQRTRDRVGLDVDHHDVLAVVDDLQRVRDAGFGNAGRLDDHLDAGMLDDGFRVGSNMCRAALERVIERGCGILLGGPPGGCQLGLRPPDVEIGDCNDVHTFRQPRLG